MRKRLFGVANGDPRRLVEAVAHRLELSPALAEALVRRGAVQVDRKRVTDVGAEVSVGVRVTVFQAEPAAHTPLVVVHRDEWLVVVDKPAGMPSQATPTESAEALDARVRTELLAEARLLHRLDRDASGLVIFSTHDRSRSRLQAALTEGKIDRRYLAVVDGRLEGEGGGVIDLKIGHDGRDPRKRVALPKNHPAGEQAKSHYRALQVGDRETLVALSLETGRTHQLRVHLSAIGHPIVGDRLYGGSPGPRLLLHAVELRLLHPGDGRSLTLEASPSPPWDERAAGPG